MAELLILLAKSVVIAVFAAIAAWLPWAVLNAADGGLSLTLLPIALIGSLAVGLPVALLTYHLAGNELRKSPKNVFLAANFAGVVMLLVTSLLGSLFGGMFFGIPSMIAANVFALFGWFWILKPQREALNV